MKKNNKFEEIELLEQRLSQKLEVYKSYKNSQNNNTYFDSISSNALSKIEKKNKPFFQFNPSVGYAMVFIISFIVSYQLFNFNESFTFFNSNFYFSETTIWIEEEEYLSSVLDEEIDLDYVNYIQNEIEYSSSRFISNDINQLSDRELDEVYENIKNKKIF